MDSWTQIRRLARDARQATGYGHALAQANLVVKAGVKQAECSIVPLPRDDPLLGGAHSALQSVNRFILVDDDLPEAPRWFAIAHELGHWHLHASAFRCDTADIDEAPTTARLPIGEGRVETYNPRQRRELEANVFAAEFLLPRAILRQQFMAGDRLAALVAGTGLSETAVLNQLGTSLLTAPEAVPLPPAPSIPLRLDPKQQQAARVSRGPLLVDAGPGTGKTSALIGRTLFLLEDNVPPERILALTFSNRAAQEMRERLVAVVPNRAHAFTIATFHAYCLDLLRRYPAAAGVAADARIIDSVDAALLLEQRLSELQLVEYVNLYNPALYLPDILRAVSRAKDELVGPQQYAALAEAMAAAAQSDADRAAATRAAEVARVYQAYETLLSSLGRLDFGDLIVKAVLLLERHEDVRASLRASYAHILVDEYQDVNRASAVLLRYLAGDGDGLWVVGDVRQSIYRFRGASPANVGRFEQDFPGARRAQLDVNYRSVEPLVRLFTAAAHAIPMDGPLPPVWQAHRGKVKEQTACYWAEATTDAAEATGIAGLIQRLRRAGYTYADQALLCRTNRQATALAAVLEEYQIPVAYVGDLFQRPEVKDMLAVLALTAEADGASLARVAQLPDHLLSAADVVAIRAGARTSELPFPRALLYAAEYQGVSSGGAQTAIALGERLSGISYGRTAWDCLTRYLFTEGDYVVHLLRANEVQALQALLALGQLLHLARAFALQPIDDTVEVKRAFLEYVRRLIATEDPRLQMPVDTADLDAVRVLTAHAAKGLEFPVVFIPNLAEQRFPPRKPWDPTPPPVGLYADDGNGRDDAEEMCLFFVALSRARDILVLSHASQYGSIRRRPSPLWTMVEDALRAAGITPVRWEEDQQDEVPEPDTASASPRSDKIELTVAEVERYLICPRQYYYRYVLQLPEHQEELGYKRFHDCVRETATWARDQYFQNGKSPDWASVLAALDSSWTTDGPVGHVHEAHYRMTAEAMLQRLWNDLNAGPPRAAWQRELAVELPDCRLIVRFDQSEADVGGIRLVRYRTGKPQDDHRREPRLALYREAARQHAGATPVSVELHYLGDGSHVAVPPQDRYERPRLDKLNAAAQGIARQQFPASPETTGTCSRCPYNLVCPA